MILADTSVWVDYLRGQNPEMKEMLDWEQIVMHPFIVAEIALGSLKNRRTVLAQMDTMTALPVARLEEVRHLIESHKLYSRGIGLTDAHLLASCRITPGTQLWTSDNAMKRVAEELRIWKR